MRSAEAAAGAWPQERDSHGARSHEDALPFLSESFDVVTLLDIDRLPAPVSAVREARRVLKPGGCLVISATRGDWTRRAPVRRFFRLFDDFTDVRIVGLVAWFPTIGWCLETPLARRLLRSRVRTCEPAEARTLVGAGVKR